jgi:hypothetical protein
MAKLLRPEFGPAFAGCGACEFTVEDFLIIVLVIQPLKIEKKEHDAASQNHAGQAEQSRLLAALGADCGLRAGKFGHAQQAELPQLAKGA